jgi:hypothetical protein
MINAQKKKLRKKMILSRSIIGGFPGAMIYFNEARSMTKQVLSLQRDAHRAEGRC